jgi:hypothetical protein
MARRKTESSGEGDVIDRNDGGGLETGDSPGTLATPMDLPRPSSPLPHEDAAEEAQSAANLAGQTDRLAIKRANFSRLASKRVSGVLERLSVLKQLSNTSTYDWTQEQHDKIFNTIEAHLDEVHKAFTDAKNRKVRDKSLLRFEV